MGPCSSSIPPSSSHAAEGRGSAVLPRDAGGARAVLDGALNFDAALLARQSALPSPRPSLRLSPPAEHHLAQPRHRRLRRTSGREESSSESTSGPTYPPEDRPAFVREASTPLFPSEAEREGSSHSVSAQTQPHHTSASFFTLRDGKRVDLLVGSHKVGLDIG